MGSWKRRRKRWKPGTSWESHRVKWEIRLEEQIEELEAGIQQAKLESDGSRFTVKQLEKTKKSLRRRLEKLENREKKDDVVTFEELGVDRLYVDEAHYYKNAFLYTKMRNVAGIAQNEAQKSADMEGEEEQDEEKEEHQSLHDRITAIKQNNQRQEGKEAAMRTIEACIG